MADSEPTGVAAFDFDGTLTHRDTLGPFFQRVVGRNRLWRAVGAEATRTAKKLRRPSRDSLKLGLIARLFTGLDADEFATHGRQYAALLPTQFRPATLDRLRWHQDQGHRVLFVSAGLGTYLRPLGADLGLDHVIAVEVEEADGHLTGRTTGPNVRRAEKARLLGAWIDAHVDGGRDAAEVWAYGDSAGDTELLAMADHPTWMGKREGRATP